MYMLGSVMRKEELLKILRENRDKHKTVFDEAVKGYHAAALKRLEEEKDRIEKGSLEVIRIMLPVPENHTRDYDAVIRAVELDVRDEIELEEHEFVSFVMDDWTWKRQWLDTSNLYAAAATTANYRE